MTLSWKKTAAIHFTVRSPLLRPPPTSSNDLLTASLLMFPRISIYLSLLCIYLGKIARLNSVFFSISCFVQSEKITIESCLYQANICSYGTDQTVVMND